ncbi:MAG: transposase [Candidatus Promineofilum sp.]|nr:transposase [Promineifilum sp.]
MRKEPLVAGATYHVYNRGVNYNDIFYTRANWLFFLSRLRTYCPAEMGTIIAYCLMPNHYHLIIQVAAANFGLEAMQPLMVSYTKAINNQEGQSARSSGTVQARGVKSDGDLVHLSRYIHANPVAAGFVAAPEDWEFSSYRDYVRVARAARCPSRPPSCSTSPRPRPTPNMSAARRIRARGCWRRC